MDKTKTKQPVYLNVWEKSLIKEYLNDGIEDCDSEMEHYKQQRQIKYEKGQLERVKEYERAMIETMQLRQRLSELVKRFENDR